MVALVHVINAIVSDIRKRPSMIKGLILFFLLSIVIAIGLGVKHNTLKHFGQIEKSEEIG